MGGFGSGRHSYSSTPTCESTHSIDLASLRRRGMLKPGVYSLAWLCRGPPRPPHVGRQCIESPIPAKAGILGPHNRGPLPSVPHLRWRWCRIGPG
jgi:hypothetical protein